MYAIQCLKKFGKFTKGDFAEIEPLYFALEWEAITKKRPVASSMQGYKFVKEQIVYFTYRDFSIKLVRYTVCNILDYRCLYSGKLQQYQYCHLQTYKQQYKVQNYFYESFDKISP